jgi:DNA-binding NarL/FixJ family response regulator
MKHRTLLVEDHPLMRQTLSQFVSAMANVDLIGAVGSGKEALAFCETAEPALALIDVSLPEMSGIELVREMRALHPEVACLMLSGHQEVTYIRRALANGARGYVLKGDPEELLQAIDRVLDGDTYLSDTVRDKLAAAGREG